MLIIDNLLSSQEQEELKNIFLGFYFPWYYNPTTVGDYKTTKDNNTFEYCHFCHNIIIEDETDQITKVNSDYIFVVDKIINKLQEKLKKELIIYRAKVNLQTKVSNSLLYNMPHIDFFEKVKYLTMLYYVNDSDGKTYIFKDEKDLNGNWKIDYEVESKEGRILIFDGKKLHSGSHPKEGVRVVINFALNFQEGII